VVAAETGIHVEEIGERAYEQTGTDEKDQRNRDLAGDQEPP
jgi:hypothetical protein